MSGFADMLSFLRRRENLTQQELAEKLGLAKSTISMYEKGVRKPSYEMLEAIADFFNVSMDTLRGSEDTPKQNIEDDAELLEYLEYLRTRPEARILMSTMRGATKEEVEENVRFIEALRKSRHAD